MRTRTCKMKITCDPCPALGIRKLSLKCFDCQLEKSQTSSRSDVEIYWNPRLRMFTGQFCSTFPVSRMLSFPGSAVSYHSPCTGSLALCTYPILSTIQCRSSNHECIDRMYRTHTHREQNAARIRKHKSLPIAHAHTTPSL